MLALLNPKGRTLWRKEKQTLWGLCFANEYKQPNPLDPQVLFAGQWVDEESGLVYNRFRYYDPESGNYISSDPIGLNGGESGAALLCKAQYGDFITISRKNLTLIHKTPNILIGSVA